MTLDHAYGTRDLVMRRLKEDLLGGDPDVHMHEAPLSRFVTGILYPEIDGAADVVEESVEAQQEGDGEAEEGGTQPDGGSDPAVAMSRIRFPRSMGLTFAVTSTHAASAEVTVDANRYVEGPEGEWTRVQLTPWVERIDLSDPGFGRREVAPGLDMVVHTRAAREGIVAVTLTLVNVHTAPRAQRDGFCWFNPAISVHAQGTAFRERPPVTIAGVDEAEVRSQRLLFRDVQSFAVGHGCAVTWHGTKPDHLTTTFLPEHELLLSEAAGGPAIPMVELAEAPDLAVLDSLVDGYEAWVAGLEDEMSESSAEDEETLRAHVAEASAAVDRMRDGVSLLRTDADVAEAFRLMNLAMAEQRSRQDHHRAGGRGNPPSTSGASWRPFQIAFILTNLMGLADAKHPDRKVADLLWFPTGGGKTEAYLGIIGVAILLRRRRNPRAAGVSVLMRYTLRLLTLQQYQRATGLICALEMQRQACLPKTAPISIGLWVGQKSTPNSAAEAARFLKKARKPGSADLDDDSSDPVQLRQCPWCGHPLDHRDYEVIDKTSMSVSCGSDGCAFRNGLPVHIIDSDVYSERPSLVIGTVDKFAMMPWKAEVGSILGSPVVAKEYEDLPPDVIVQDELHLISGPLGTMVGLYETAVDAIVGDEAPPKVVASTATIRRATDQVRAVFAREARQFPPPGATYADSHFAVEADRLTKASRLYVGAMAPGASQTTLMVRVYASLLQSASMVAQDDESADLYWTLLGYFNSLRVLGGAYIQVLDDVPDQMKVIATRRSESVRDPRNIREMTSRKKSSEIPRELQILERRRGEADAADVVLATNMISVGVDVDRLGLMVVMGQPQTTSEYIQATSRVGRRDPGLVVTVYNASRSRDLSHYENFAAYHRSLYRHVEATGATPFAPRARDRALHAVLVSLARHTIPSARASTAAGSADEWETELREIVQTVLDRVRAVRLGVGPIPTDESDAVIEGELDALVDRWLASHRSHYEGWFGNSKGALLVDAGRTVGQTDDALDNFPPQDPPWPTLTSMRDVDAESSVYLVWRKKERRER